MPEPTPTTQINFPPAPHSPDHDLLLTFKAEVTTKLDRVISDVKDLKDDLASRVSGLETEKLSKEDFDNFKTEFAKDFDEFKAEIKATDEKQQEQIDFANNWIRYGLGSVGLINFILLALQVYKSFHP